MAGCKSTSGVSCCASWHLVDAWDPADRIALDAAVANVQTIGEWDVHRVTSGHRQNSPLHPFGTVGAAVGSTVNTSTGEVSGFWLDMVVRVITETARCNAFLELEEASFAGGANQVQRTWARFISQRAATEGLFRFRVPIYGRIFRLQSNIGGGAGSTATWQMSAMLRGSY